MGNSRLPRRGRASITRTSTKCSQCSSTLARRTQSRTSASQLIVSWSESEGRPAQRRGGRNAHVTASDESEDSNTPVHAGAPQVAQFLHAIFRAAPHDSYLEIRTLPVERAKNGRRFLRIRSCNDEVSSRRPAPSSQKQVYCGICPRSREAGTASNVAFATCLWADLDDVRPSVSSCP